MPPAEKRPASDEEIRVQAADWFARMHAPDGNHDVADHEAWLAADPRHRIAYDRLMQRWDQTTFLANSSVGKRRDLAKAAVWWRPDRRLAAVAGIAAIMLAGVVALSLSEGTPRQGSPTPTQLATQANNGPAMRVIRLSDGSTVSLDSGATIRVVFTATERRLRLVDGRARFAVAHDPARRFIVDAGDGSIIAHGTVFDVTVAPGGVRVILLKGEVEVRKIDPAARGAGKPVVLAPGEQVTFAPARPISPVTRAAAERPSHGMIAFDGDRLADAVTTFNRLNAMQIRIGDAESANLRISGAFRASDPAGFASGVAAAFALKVVQLANGDVTIVRQAVGSNP